MCSAIERTLRRLVVALLPVFLAGCGGSHLAGDAEEDDSAIEGDATPLDGGPEDATGVDGEDASADESDAEPLGDGFILDAAGWEGSEYVVLPPVSGCGDGVLDPGEECDDWNRLNGDGCDWLCRLGDGDPPPVPEPGVPDYVPSGDPAPLPGSAIYSGEWERPPLAWTGREFATAWFQAPEVDTDPGVIRFWRFDSSGRRIDAEWRMPSLWTEAGLEVVWTGSGFGLFFAEGRSGLWYLRLDEEGKPLGDPVLVEGDPRARSPAADVASDGTLVVAWVHDQSDVADWWTECWVDGLCNKVRVRRIDVDGDLLGPVYTIEETAAWGTTDIAVGDGGFGMVFADAVDVEHGRIAFRFERLDETFGSPVFSGVLGGEGLGDVKWLAAESCWVTAWSTGADGATPPEMDVAFFSADGSLAGPPVRNVAAEADWFGMPVRVAAGDGGLSLVTSWNSGGRLSYLRTGRNGVAVSSLRDVYPATAGGANHGPFNAVWTDAEGFAVLFGLNWPAELCLAPFVRAE